MKNKIILNIKLLTVLFGLALGLFSCTYETIMDANYPEQLIYLPAAVNGTYIIDNVPTPTIAVPTPGNPYKFTVDLETRKFTVPLGVYRSGVDNTGSFTVDIAVNTDTVSALIAAGKLSNVELLPADKYTIDQKVDITEGKDFASAKLFVDLDFLRNNAPGKRYALGISISSGQREVNPKLNTAVVVIDTKIMVPKADFTYKVDLNDWKKISFTNTSSYAVSSSWDFGDGSAVFNGTSASHTFPDVGLYPVSLTVTGVEGSQSVKNMDVAIFDLANIVNIATGKPASSSDVLGGYSADKAVDGVISHASRWVSQPAGEHWIEIDLQQEYYIVSFKTLIGAQGEFNNPVKNFSFQVMINNVWTDVVNVTGNSDPQYQAVFPVIKTSRVRFFVPAYNNNQVRLYEIEVYALPNN